MSAKDSKQVQQPAAFPVPSKQRRYLKPEVTPLRLAQVIQGGGFSVNDGSTKQPDF